MLEKAKLKRWKADHRLPGGPGVGVGWNVTGWEGNFSGNENVLYHDCGGGYMTVCVCQDLLNLQLKLENFIVCKFTFEKAKTKMKTAKAKQEALTTSNLSSFLHPRLELTVIQNPLFVMPLLAFLYSFIHLFAFLKRYILKSQLFLIL